MACGDPSPSVRAQAIRGLARFSVDECVPVFCRLLALDDSHVVRCVCRALASAAGPVLAGLVEAAARPRRPTDLGAIARG